MRILIHFHAYYQKQSEDILERLLGLPPFDGKIVVTYDKKARWFRNFKKMLQSLPIDCVILPVENIGYDIWPFILALKREDMLCYDLVLKIHTKGREHYISRYTLLNGRFYSDRLWSDALVNALLTRSTFQNCLSIFQRSPEVGLVGADAFCVFESCSTCQNGGRVNDFISKSCLANVDGFHFIAGTMFMARSHLLLPLLVLKASDFLASGGSGSNFTMAHICERLFGAVIEAQGYKVRGVPASISSIRLFCYNLQVKLLIKYMSMMRTFSSVVTYLRCIVSLRGRQLIYAASGKQDGYYHRRPFHCLKTCLWGLRMCRRSDPVRFYAAVYGSALFDDDWYCRQYGINRKIIDPVRHYILYGCWAGYNPSPQFDGLSYWRANPDTVGICPLAHWLAEGRFENRVMG